MSNRASLGRSAPRPPDMSSHPGPCSQIQPREAAPPSHVCHCTPSAHTRPIGTTPATRPAPTPPARRRCAQVTQFTQADARPEQSGPRLHQSCRPEQLSISHLLPNLHPRPSLKRAPLQHQQHARHSRSLQGPEIPDPRTRCSARRPGRAQRHTSLASGTQALAADAKQRRGQQPSPRAARPVPARRRPARGKCPHARTACAAVPPWGRAAAPRPDGHPGSLGARRPAPPPQLPATRTAGAPPAGLRAPRCRARRRARPVPRARSERGELRVLAQQLHGNGRRVVAGRA